MAVVAFERSIEPYWLLPTSSPLKFAKLNGPNILIRFRFFSLRLLLSSSSFEYKTYWWHVIPHTHSHIYYEKFYLLFISPNPDKLLPLLIRDRGDDVRVLPMAKSPAT